MCQSAKSRVIAAHMALPLKTYASYGGLTSVRALKTSEQVPERRVSDVMSMTIAVL